MNFPETFLSRTKAILGGDFDSFIQAMGEEPPVSIRLNKPPLRSPLNPPQNPLKGTLASEKTEDDYGLLRTKSPLEDLGVGVGVVVPWASNAYYLKERPSFTFDPLFHAGCYYVQEASSMFLEQIVKTFITEPAKCLDLCAAPGGKSTHLSSILPEGSLLVANEVIRSRSYILSENLIKWGNPYTIVANNDPEIVGSSLPCSFDLIVADVPCSGEGMFRKDKNAILEWSLANVKLCAERQQRIIAGIWPALKPGGILVYSTCTFNLEENEENIHWMVKTFDAKPLDISLPEEWNITRAKKYDYPVFRFIPGKTKGEGFFIAILRKPDDSSSNETRIRKNKKDKIKKDKTIIPQQINDWITDFELFSIQGENNIISAVPQKYEPEYLEMKAALRIIHAGITIGEIKGKDIIPDHSLAMSVNFNPEAFPLVEVDKQTAINYLRRESVQLPSQTPRGYIVLTFQNQPVGFVKNIGNRANNLYPQEWRIKSRIDTQKLKLTLKTRIDIMKISFFILVFACATFFSFGQTNNKLSLDSALNNIMVQVLLFPQEKIYLQTDKPYYISGEKIFFRIFLLNAFSHQPTEMSRYVYVELINPKDSVVIRQQIRPENNMHYGALPLPEDLKQGYYRIRTYTRFMENIGEDYFFNRTVYIADPTDTTKIELSTSSPNEKWEVTFYPEGGNLIAGKSCAIAFKALSADGQPIELKGDIYDGQDNLITDFTTIHEGMGRFSLTPEAGKRYYAICQKDNQNVRVKLPEVNTDAFSLATVWRQNKFWISVKNSEKIPQQKLYLIIHSGGMVIYSDEWDFSKEMITIDRLHFPSGVSHLLLLNEDYHPLSERLVFNLNDDWMMPEVITDKNVYQKREQVKMRINCQTGNFAISVTDDKDIKIDTTQNILTTILLTSELRGYIDNPAYYFQGTRESEYAADLLMQTHGWTRYDVSRAMRGDFQYLRVANEESQSFSGMVKGGLLSKPYKNAKMMIISTNSSFFDTTETDETGRFTFNNFEFPDSTNYFIQALTKKGYNIVELIVDAIIYPKLSPIKLYFSKQKELQLLDPEKFNDYVVKANQKYIYENGMRMVHLGEVTVRGRRIYRNDEQRYPGLDRVITAEEIVKGGGADMIRLIRQLGIQVRTGVRRPEKPDSRFFEGNDDLIQDMMFIHGKLIQIPDELRFMDIYDLQAIGVDPKSGRPIPIMKSFDERMQKTKYNIATITPLGYQKPVAFYSPKYDTPKARNQTIPDLRSTIYWKPDVIANSTNKGSLDFYTADSSSTYSVVIEGATSDGKLIYQRVDSFIKVE